jgi:UDP-N-acetylglucosamine acyltransferase
MGRGNVVHPFAVLGGAPQDKKRHEGTPSLEIGDGNVFREHVTVHRGAAAPTRIGSSNLFMASSHVAHDVVVGDGCVFANAVQLAGHVIIEDQVTFGGLAGVAQFARIGEGAFVAAGSMVERSVPPFVIVQGDRARVRAINRVGLERRGVSRETIAELERLFRALYMSRRPRASVLAELVSDDPLGKKLLAALRGAAAPTGS